MINNCEEEEDDDDDNMERIKASELSKETLEMLTLLGLNQDNNNNGDIIFLNNGDPSRRDLHNLIATDPIDAVNVLKNEGVVRLNNILSTDLCDKCIISILNTLSLAINEGTDHFGSSSKTFGNIDANYNRWDMFVNKSDISIAESYLSMFDNKNSVLNLIFDQLFDGLNAEVFEFGALISKNGATSQRIHSDTTYQSNCPLYTVFIAIQNVIEELGPTIFIKNTNNNPLAHQNLRHKRTDYLSKAIYHQALLNQGDIVIMDSRTFHAGDKNTFGNRVLLYFTLLNPSFTDMGGGSKHDNINLTLHSLSKRSSFT